MKAAQELEIHPALRDVQTNKDGYRARFKDLGFIVSACVEADGKWWLHASVSRRDRGLPTYDDLVTLKHYCIGDHREALQVFPSEDKFFHGKQYTYEVLHLWSCLDGDVGHLAPGRDMSQMRRLAALPDQLRGQPQGQREGQAAEPGWHARAGHGRRGLRHAVGTGAAAMSDEQRYYDVLKKIAKDYGDAAYIERNSEKRWGLPYHEALEMTFENIQRDAAMAIKGKRRPRE